MIDINKPFCLYALCAVEYNGRACSTLELGNYLIVYKLDGTFLVHGGDLCSPRNYQQFGSNLDYEGGLLISRRKNEIIKVNIHNIIFYEPMEDWSTSKIQITKTEKELAMKLYHNWHDYFNDDFYSIEIEYETGNGPVDLVGITTTNVCYVVETKRGKASISDVTQLKRYVDSLNDKFKVVLGYIASPAIGTNALKYLNQNVFNWIKIDFDPSI